MIDNYGLCHGDGQVSVSARIDWIEQGMEESPTSKDDLAAKGPTVIISKTVAKAWRKPTRGPCIGNMLGGDMHVEVWVRAFSDAIVAFVYMCIASLLLWCFLGLQSCCWNWCCAACYRVFKGIAGTRTRTDMDTSFRIVCLFLVLRC